MRLRRLPRSRCSKVGSSRSRPPNRRCRPPPEGARRSPSRAAASTSASVLASRFRSPASPTGSPAKPEPTPAHDRARTRLRVVHRASGAPSGAAGRTLSPGSPPHHRRPIPAPRRRPRPTRATRFACATDSPSPDHARAVVADHLAARARPARPASRRRPTRCRRRTRRARFVAADSPRLGRRPASARAASAGASRRPRADPARPLRPRRPLVVRRRTMRGRVADRPRRPRPSRAPASSRRPARRPPDHAAPRRRPPRRRREPRVALRREAHRLAADRRLPRPFAAPADSATPARRLLRGWQPPAGEWLADAPRHRAGDVTSAAVLGRPGEVEPVAAALALALRRETRAKAATVAVVGRCCRTGSRASGAAAAAARSAARGAGLQAHVRGRLAWVRLEPGDPQLAAAVRRVTLVAAPAVLAVTAPRTAAIDEALAEQDLLVIVAADPEGPLARLAAAGLTARAGRHRAPARPRPGARARTRRGPAGRPSAGDRDEEGADRHRITNDEPGRRKVS